MIISAAFHLCAVCALILYLVAFFKYLQVLFRGAPVDHALSFLQSGALFHLLFAVVYLLREEKAGTLFLPDFADSLNFIGLLLVLVYLLLQQLLRIDILGVVVAPLALLFTLFGGMLFHTESHVVQQSIPHDLTLWLHIIAAVGGEALFVLAFSVSLLLLFKERMLKRKALISLLEKLPSLTLLDNLNGRLLRCGFVLMLFAVLLGFFFGLIHQLSLAAAGARLYWSFAILGVYAVLVAGREITGLRGSRAALFSAAGFILVIASYVGLYAADRLFHVF